MSRIALVLPVIFLLVLSAQQVPTPQKFDSSSVIAIATAVYGAATLLLVIQIWRDRVQRETHYKEEIESRRLNELRSAFYEAAGYWEGHRATAMSVRTDASQVGKEFEALIRLECQLRLNNYNAEADSLGFAVRANISDISTQLRGAGVALGLLPAEYHQRAVRPTTDRS